MAVQFVLGGGPTNANRISVTALHYIIMGRVLTEGGDYWPKFSGNLRKARKIWMRMTRILGREGEDLKISWLFFKAVVHAVLLFGSETWVLTPRMGRALGSFQKRVARRLTRRQRRREGRW